MGEIKVGSIQQFLDCADVVSQRTIDMENRLNEIEGIFQKSGAYWVGEAGDAHRKLYPTQKSIVMEIVHQTKKHPGVLQTTAGIFRSGINTALKTTESLKKKIYT